MSQRAPEEILLDEMQWQMSLQDNPYLERVKAKEEWEGLTWRERSCELDHYRHPRPESRHEPQTQQERTWALKASERALPSSALTAKLCVP